jgi:hypothetical protein
MLSANSGPTPGLQSVPQGSAQFTVDSVGRSRIAITQQQHLGAWQKLHEDPEIISKTDHMIFPRKMLPEHIQCTIPSSCQTWEQLKGWFRQLPVVYPAFENQNLELLQVLLGTGMLGQEQYHLQRRLQEEQLKIEQWQQEQQHQQWQREAQQQQTRTLRPPTPRPPYPSYNEKLNEDEVGTRQPMPEQPSSSLSANNKSAYVDPREVILQAQ